MLLRVLLRVLLLVRLQVLLQWQSPGCLPMPPTNPLHPPLARLLLSTCQG